MNTHVAAHLHKLRAHIIVRRAMSRIEGEA